jgi:hypothetical protein
MVAGTAVLPLPSLLDGAPLAALGWASWLRYALKKGLDVSATFAELDERCDSRISDCPQGKAGNELIKLLGCLHIRDEAKRDASGYRPARHDAALLSKFLSPGECRSNDAFDEGAAGVFGKRQPCCAAVKLNQESHAGVPPPGMREQFLDVTTSGVKRG